jgi:hypothetical protein
MVDRDLFVERLRERDDYPFGGRSGRDAVLAMLLADRGMTDELEAILNKDEEQFRTRAVASDLDAVDQLRIQTALDDDAPTWFAVPGQTHDWLPSRVDCSEHPDRRPPRAIGSR